MPDWLGSEVLVALDIAVLAALTLAIAVGFRVLRRLAALRRAGEDWQSATAAFAERAERAEAQLARFAEQLAVEEARRREAAEADRPPPASIPSSAPPQAPARLAAPKPAAAGRPAIFSMQ